MFQQRLKTLGTTHIIRRKKINGPNIIKEFTCQKMNPAIYSVRTVLPNWHILYGTGFSEDMMLPEGATLISSTEMHVVNIPTEIAGMKVPQVKQVPDQLYAENENMNRLLKFEDPLSPQPPLVNGTCVNVIGDVVDDNLVVKKIEYPEKLSRPVWRIGERKIAVCCFADNMESTNADAYILIGVRRPIIQKDYNVVGALRQLYEKLPPPPPVPVTDKVLHREVFAIRGPGDCPNTFSRKTLLKLMPNPSFFMYDGLLFLVTDGQSIKEVQKYGGPTDVFDAMEATLLWRLAVPICFGEDLIIDKCPHVYICGNCDENGTKFKDGCLFVTVKNKIVITV